MKAIDTNILARYVMHDDPIQSPIAERVLMSEECYVSDSVLVETAWLLSSRFGVSRADLATTLADLLLLPSIHVSDRGWIEWAIERFAAGADFADMVHMVTGRGSDAFISFENHLAKLAGPDAPIPVERPS